MTHTPAPRRVAIVGAGMVGLSTAWYLQEHGVEVVMSETTLERTQGCIASRPLGVATVRGRAAPVHIHTPAS